VCEPINEEKSNSKWPKTSDFEPQNEEKSHSKWPKTSASETSDAVTNVQWRDCHFPSFSSKTKAREIQSWQWRRRRKCPLFLILFGLFLLSPVSTSKVMKPKTHVEDKNQELSYIQG
jgi:hypothetical protein